MIWNGPTMQKVNIHDEADKRVKNDNWYQYWYNTDSLIIPLQNNIQLYVHLHQYKQFKDSKKFSYLK